MALMWKLELKNLFSLRKIPNLLWLKNIFETIILFAPILNSNSIIGKIFVLNFFFFQEPKWKKPRGVSQRNVALKWLRENRNRSTDLGVIYFADDDNTYDLQLFNEVIFSLSLN